MTTGDAALAAGMDITAGTDDRRNGWEEINKTRDYIALRTSAVTPISKGGTGATTQAAAQAALGVVPDLHPVDGRIPKYDPSGRLEANDPYGPLHVVNKQYADGVRPPALEYGAGAFGWRTANGMWATDDGIFIAGNHLWLGNPTPAVSAYTVAYIDGTGRLAKGASSERYKDDIAEIDPDDLGDIWPRLSEFTMRGDPDKTNHIGYIAERLTEHPDQEPFVVYDGEGRPDSIDFIGLLIAQNAQLRQEVDHLDQLVAQQVLHVNDLTARIEALEVRP